MRLLAWGTPSLDGLRWLPGRISVCGETYLNVPTPQAAAIDTLGAGDVYHGALALAIGEGLMPEQPSNLPWASGQLDAPASETGQKCSPAQKLMSFMCYVRP
jgi:sugar/nucleoside kinase (ribokinase family)